jgi:hypothetical protein
MPTNDERRRLEYLEKKSKQENPVLAEIKDEASEPKRKTVEGLPRL